MEGEPKSYQGEEFPLKVEGCQNCTPGAEATVAQMATFVTVAGPPASVMTQEMEKIQDTMCTSATASKIK
jgi:hypothetical protein